MCSTLTSITIPEGVAFPDIKDVLNLFGDDRQSHRAAGDLPVPHSQAKGRFGQSGANQSQTRG